MKSRWAQLKNSGFLRWMRPGTGMKRLILLTVAGFVLALLAACLLWTQVSPESLRRFRGPVMLMALGVLTFLAGVGALVAKLWQTRKQSGMATARWKDEIFRKKMLDHGPRIVAIGGGSGMSTLLRGLKTVSSNLTAVVTVADNGGNSGQLREDLGVLPPGDIRNCIIALSQVEPVMERLMQYRFPEGTLQGQCLGNLLLVATSDISGGFLEGIRTLDDVLAVTGQVLPVSLENLSLNGIMSGGQLVQGESSLGRAQADVGGRIHRVWLEPGGAQPLPEVLEAIRQADIIVIGPGSLYTSLLPNLLIDGVSSAIKRSGAIKFYVANIMTQPGETQGYTLQDHLKAIWDHCGKGLIDIALVNRSGKIPEDILAHYIEDGAEIVTYDAQRVKADGIELVEADLAEYKKGRIRHQSDLLALKIMDLYSKRRRK